MHADFLNSSLSVIVTLGSSFLVCSITPPSCISYTYTLNLPPSGTKKHSSSFNSLLLWRDILKANMCFLFCSFIAQPSAVESMKKVQDAHIPGLDESLTVILA